jgi:hypothetical protein
MARMLERFERGQRLTAEYVNVNAAMTMAHENHTGANGIKVDVMSNSKVTRLRYTERPAYFYLQNPLTYPETNGNKTEAPYTEDAQRVLLQPALSGSDVPSDAAQTSLTHTLYYTMALRNSENYYIGLPVFRDSMYVQGWFNRQYGRWEIIEPQPQLEWRAKLDGNLSKNGSATASVWTHKEDDTDADTTVNVTVHDWMLLSGTSILAGKKVLIRWFPDDLKFYVTSAEC